jgi:hypothetical protein
LFEKIEKLISLCGHLLIMTKKESHSIISVEDIFKSNVKIENDVLTLDPSVSFSFIRGWIDWVLERCCCYLFRG